MDDVLPNEPVEHVITAGGKKATVSVKNLLIRDFYLGGIFAGIVLSGMPWLRKSCP